MFKKNDNSKEIKAIKQEIKELEKAVNDYRNSENINFASYQDSCRDLIYITEGSEEYFAKIREARNYQAHAEMYKKMANDLHIRLEDLRAQLSKL